MASQKKWNELYILAHKLVRVHVGTDTQIIALFLAYNTDGRANFVHPYVFWEQISGLVQKNLDDINTADGHLQKDGLIELGVKAAIIRGGVYLPHRVEVLGTESSVTTYASKTRPISLAELVGSRPAAPGNIGIAQQRRDEFLVRMTIDLVNDPAGQSFRTFMLSFSGTVPQDLPAKMIRGTFGTTRLGTFEGNAQPIVLRRARDELDLLIKPFVTPA